ncbi:MAG: twin-arginine translocase subunit TatB [Hyphomicrobiales bacterium]|nr:twin-arginine translocase subunit TatB [Hyphomicrobiales bacterium]
MFDLDVGKMLIVGAVALVVIPPKDFPRVMRQLGQALGKMRRMANEFQGQFMDAIREADLEGVKKEMTGLADSARVDVAFDPVRDVKNHIEGALEPARHPEHVEAPQQLEMIEHEPVAAHEPGHQDVIAFPAPAAEGAKRGDGPKDHVA